MAKKHVFTVGKLTHYMKRYKPYTIHVIPTKLALDVYYQKDGHPMVYAFRIPLSECDGLESVFSIAEANIWEYRWLFDDK